MYFYSIYGWEESLILYHSKRFTKEEFDKMCKEAPKLECKCGERDFSFYNAGLIVGYLINNYGFKDIEFVEEFFVDNKKNN